MDFEMDYDDSAQEIFDRLDTFERLGSGWTLLRILAVHITLSEYAPRTFGCRTILPSELASKRYSIVNVDDNTHQYRCGTCVVHVRYIILTHFG